MEFRPLSGRIYKEASREEGRNKIKQTDGLDRENIQHEIR